MADFVQTMKDWRRMCRFYADKSTKDEHSCMDMCPLGRNTACGMIEDALDSDIETMAGEIAKWAKEHPEPVYPTWREWLLANRIIGDTDSDYGVGLLMRWKRIPADVAEKLGLQPKEGV